MSRLKGALIGFGKVAEMAHLPAFAARNELVLLAVAEPREDRRAQARALIPQVRLYPDLGTLLKEEPDLDFVDICTPPAEHPGMCLAGLKKGLHVLCEKPLTLDLKELKALESAAARAGRALVTVHNWKFAPLLSASINLLKTGAIGRLTHLDWQVLRPPGSGGGLTSWRTEASQVRGGILVDHGWHAFYLAQAWAGEEPEALKTRLTRPDPTASGPETEAEVGLKFPQASGRIFLTWQASHRANLGRLAGTEGEMLLEDDRLVLAHAGRPEEVISFPAKLSAGSHHPEWMAGVLDEFMEEIRQPEPRGKNLLEAAGCARLIESAYRSWEAGSVWLPFGASEVPQL